MLTTKDVAQRLRTSPDHVRALIAYGRLSAVNINHGGKRPVYRVRSSDLARFEESGTVAVAPALPRRRSRVIPNLIGL